MGGDTPARSSNGPRSLVSYYTKPATEVGFHQTVFLTSGGPFEWFFCCTFENGKVIHGPEWRLPRWWLPVTVGSIALTVSELHDCRVFGTGDILPEHLRKFFFFVLHIARIMFTGGRPCPSTRALFAEQRLSPSHGRPHSL